MFQPASAIYDIAAYKWITLILHTCGFRANHCILTITSVATTLLSFGMWYSCNARRRGLDTFFASPALYLVLSPEQDILL